MREGNGVKPQQVCENKIFSSSFSFSSNLLRAAHSESDPERCSCTVAAQVWLHLAGSSRELVSFWFLESVWSLSGEWVELQGITQGGVLTTELQSAKRSFCLSGNFFYWECTELAALWSYFCSFTRHTCTYKTFIGVSRLTFATVMRICLRCFSAHKDTLENSKVRKRVMSKSEYLGLTLQYKILLSI